MFIFDLETGSCDTNVLKAWRVGLCVYYNTLSQVLAQTTLLYIAV